MKEIWKVSRADVYKDGTWVFEDENRKPRNADGAEYPNSTPSGCAPEVWKWFDVTTSRTSIGGGVEDLIDGIFHTSSSSSYSSSSSDQSVDGTVEQDQKGLGKSEFGVHHSSTNQQHIQSSVKNVQVLLRLQLDTGGDVDRTDVSVEEMEKCMTLEFLLSDGTDE